MLSNVGAGGSAPAAGKILIPSRVQRKTDIDDFLRSAPAAGSAPAAAAAVEKVEEKVEEKEESDDDMGTFKSLSF